MEKPEFLYHISNELPDDETILYPHENEDRNQENRDYYVFASQRPNYISCFNDKFSSFLGGYTDTDGTKLMVIVTQNIENRRMTRRNKPSSICKVSSSSFTQVRDKEGRPTDEWISKIKVPILERDIIKYEEILKNAQVFYMETKEPFGKEQYNEWVTSLKKKYSNIKEALRDLVNNKVLVYENGVLKINDRWHERKQIETEER